MKKYFLVFLIVALLPIVTYGETFNAIPVEGNTRLNGSYVYLKGYNIEGSNYYRLRDIADIFKGTNKAFNIIYDDKNNFTQVFKNRVYFGVVPIFDSNEAPLVVDLFKNSITIDGRRISLSGFNYKGYGYYRLRDLAYLLDFSVDYNSLDNGVYINTNRSFVPMGRDYVKAPSVKIPQDLMELEAELKKLYFALDKEQKDIKNKLHRGGISFSKLMSFNNTLNSFEGEFNKLYNSEIVGLSENESIKVLLGRFLNSFMEMKNSFSRLSNPILFTGLGDEERDVEEYLLQYEDMQYEFMELINELMEDE